MDSATKGVYLHAGMQLQGLCQEGLEFADTLPSMVHKKKLITAGHPDHSDELVRLRKITGQLSGVERMIIDRRYCPEILQQIRAIYSAIKALETAILRSHLSSCIKKSAKSNSSTEFDKKLTELLDLIRG